MQDDVLSIQQAYPMVFHACHTRHPRSRTNEHRISDRDSSVLAHIGSGHSLTARDLARHLGIGAPAMSATLDRLERLGYLARLPRTKVRPTRPLSLTLEGRVAMQATSVLDSDRLHLLLGQLSPDERKKAVQGVSLLARAAAHMPRKERFA